MKSYFFALVFFVFQTTFADSDHHGHHDHGKSDLVLTLNNDQKWPTDQPLRENMSAIHNHIKSRLGRIKGEKMTDNEYIDLSKKIKENIDAIFANCKLTPKADAQLHIVLAGMLSANSKLSGNVTTKEKAAAVMEILKNYKVYLKYFDHSEVKKTKDRGDK